MHIYQSIHRSIDPSIDWSVHWSIDPSIYPSIHPSIYASTYMSKCLPTCVPTPPQKPTCRAPTLASARSGQVLQLNLVGRCSFKKIPSKFLLPICSTAHSIIIIIIIKSVDHSLNLALVFFCIIEWDLFTAAPPQRATPSRRKHTIYYVCMYVL